MSVKISIERAEIKTRNFVGFSGARPTDMSIPTPSFSVAFCKVDLILQDIEMASRRPFLGRANLIQEVIYDDARKIDLQ